MDRFVMYIRKKRERQHAKLHHPLQNYLQIGDTVTLRSDIPAVGSIVRGQTHTISQIHLDKENNCPWVRLDGGDVNFYCAEWFVKMEPRMDSAEYEDIMQAQKIMEETNGDISR
jgi:preprotein translocase subunit YajC